jgi:hypothetical protein
MYTLECCIGKGWAALPQTSMHWVGQRINNGFIFRLLTPLRSHLLLQQFCTLNCCGGAQMIEMNTCHPLSNLRFSSAVAWVAWAMDARSPSMFFMAWTAQQTKPGEPLQHFNEDLH